VRFPLEGTGDQSTLRDIGHQRCPGQKNIGIHHIQLDLCEITVLYGCQNIAFASVAPPSAVDVRRMGQLETDDPLYLLE